MFSVYKIENKANGKKYIGITSRAIEARYEDHRSRASSGARNSRLYVAMRKYGVENFFIVLLEKTHDEDKVRALEREYISKFDTYTNGYNCNLGGHGHLVLSDEIKSKIGDANRGRVIGEAGRQKMSAAKAGRSECSENFGEHTQKGANNPKSKQYFIRFPDGHEEFVIGRREFCRANKISSKLFEKGRCKGFSVVGRFNDYPEREYPQVGGSAHHLHEVKI